MSRTRARIFKVYLPPKISKCSEINFTCKSFSSSLAVSPAAIAPLTISVTILPIVVVDGTVVLVVEVSNKPSDEQIKRVHGDLGSFSIMGHKIGASGVGQLSVLYNGQFLLVE